MKKIIIIIILSIHIFAEDSSAKIWSAITNNDTKTVSLLLKNGLDTSIRNEENNDSLLQYAVRSNNIAMVKLLVESGVLIDGEPSENIDFEGKLESLQEGDVFRIDGKKGYSPLQLAIELNRMPIVEFLVSKGADLNHKDIFESTPILTSIYYNNYNALVLLLNNIKSISKKDLSYLLESALSSNCSFKLIEYLVSKGAEFSLIENEEYIYDLVLNENYELTKYALSKGANITYKDPTTLNSLLKVACDNGDIKIVSLLIDLGSNINELNGEGQSPLDAAIYSKSYECIKILLEKGAIFDTEDGKYYAIFSAISEGDSTIIEILKKHISKFLNKNFENIPREQALLWASFSGEINGVKKLLDRNTNVNCENIYGVSPLMWASYSNNLEIVKFLLDKGADIDKQDNIGASSLMRACQNNSKEVVEYLIKNKANMSLGTFKKNNTALMFSIWYDSLESFSLLYNNTSNNVDDVNLLEACAIENAWKILNFLILKGADVNIKDEDGVTLLMTASHFNNFELVKLLVENGVNINEVDNNGNSALNMAIEAGNKNVIEFLIDYGVDLNILNNENNTPLLISVQNNNIELVKTLIKNGALLDIKNSDGWTPLMIAIGYGYNEICEYLLQFNFDKEEKTNDGESCLMIASTNRNTKILKFLINKKAEVDTQDNDGATPLMWAAHHNIVDSLKILIENGAKIEEKDYQGNTAIIYASKNNSIEALEYLLSKGANIKVKNQEGKGLLALAGNIETRKFLLSKGVKW